MNHPADVAQADALARTLAQTLPEPCRPDFLRLTRTLLHGPRFQWLLVEAHSDVLRDRLLHALEQVTRAAQQHSSRLPLDYTVADVPALETALIRHAKGCAVVHVLGRRGWFDAARWDAFNVRRERLANQAKARLIFWLDAEAIEAAASGAPDLWAWRSGVYSFSEGLPAITSTSRTTTVPKLAMDLRTADERRQRVADIRAWLQTSPPPSDDQLIGPLDELGRLLYELGDYAGAQQHWQEFVLPLHHRSGNAKAEAITQGRIADVLQARGQLDEALRIRQDEQLPVFERLGDVRLVAITKGKIADILQDRGQLDEALRIRQDEELPVFERFGDVQLVAVTKGQIADILQARGQLDEALRIYQDEALPIFERLGDVLSAAFTQGRIADILQARGQIEEALRIRQDEELPVYDRLDLLHEATVTKRQIADLLHIQSKRQKL